VAELAQLSSEELVARARGGERVAFEELYRRYHRPVARRLSHLGGPSLPVADLVQECFAQAYRCLARQRPDCAFGHWVLRIATNVARAHYRRSRRRPWWRLWDRPEREENVPAQGQCVDESYPTLHAVHRALSGLSPALREAVILFELEELSLAEMAATLEIPLHTAASRVRRGRERLRRELERMGCRPGLTPVAAAVPLLGSERP